jgi:hypothetical protein
MKGIQNGKITPMSKDRALDIFTILTGLGYAVSLRVR